MARESRTLTAKEKRQMLLRDRHQCQKCTYNKDLQVHHIIAVHDGGTDELDNLISLCSHCHREWHLLEDCLPPELLDETFLFFWMTVPPVHALVLGCLLIDKESHKDMKVGDWYSFLTEMIYNKRLPPLEYNPALEQD
jgi:hypothetical protein